MSKASELAVYIASRASLVTQVNGYATGIGARVFRGRMSLNKEDLPCIVLIEGDETVIDQKNSKVNVDTTFVLEGHDFCDPEHPNDKGHLIVTDLKRAIFGDDLTFGGRLKSKDEVKYQGKAIGQRPEGGDIIAASISFSIAQVEDLANP